MSMAAANAAGNDTVVKEGYVVVTEPAQTDYFVYAETGNVDEYVNAHKFHETLLNEAYNDDVPWLDWRGASYIDQNTARESHWTGNAANWIEKADFAYFSGHGNRALIGFDVIDESSGLGYADASRMHLGFGKLKWAVLDSCESLNYTVSENWKQSFSGLHMLLGWNTSTKPTYVCGMSRGEVFVKILTGNYPEPNSPKLPLWDAWTVTCQDTWGAGYSSDYDVYNAVVFDTNCLNDHLLGWGYVCPAVSGSQLYDSELIFKKNLVAPSGITKTRSLNLATEKISVDITIPEVPEKIMVYTSEKSQLDRDMVSALARDLGLSGDVRETDLAFYGSDADAEKYYFVILKDSSTISFRKISHESSQKRSQSTSISSVDDFLRNNNLMHPDALTPEITIKTAVKTQKSLTEGRPVEEENRVFSLSREIDGIPVYNSQMIIEQDSDGNIIRLFQNWRNYKPFKEVGLKSPETVIEEFQTIQSNTGDELSGRIIITDISLGYLSHAAIDTESYLQPVYVIKGYYENGDTNTPFEPVVISATADVFDDFYGLVNSAPIRQTDPEIPETEKLPTPQSTVNITEIVQQPDSVTTPSPTGNNYTGFFDTSYQELNDFSNLTLNNESIIVNVTEENQSGDYHE